MKQFILIAGIILILLMILLWFEKKSTMMEAFGVLPTASQSSYIPADIPGAVTSDPTVTKPTDKEIIDARETVYVFLDLCKIVKATTTEQHQYKNLQNRAPVFLNQLTALQMNPEIVKASDFYSKWSEYKAAVSQIQQRPLLEAFATQKSNVEQDVKNLLDAIAIFEEAYADANLEKLTSDRERNMINDLHAEATRTSVNMRTSSKPKDPIFGARVQMLTSDYQSGFAILSKLPKKVITVGQTTSFFNPDKKNVLTLEGLKKLIQNIQAEQLRLQNLRSSDSTTIARIQNLESMLVDLRGFLGKVERKEITIEEVPIKGSDAETFLEQFKSSDTLPYLLETNGVPTSSLPSSSLPTSEPAPIQSQSMGPSGPMIPTEVLNYLKNLEWSFEIKVHNDPQIAHKERVMDRIKELEQRIAAYAYNDAPIPPELQKAFQRELSSLSRYLQTYGEDSTESYFSVDNDRLASEHTRISEDERTITSPYDKDSQNLSYNSGKTYNPYTNTSSQNADAMIRPGFLMSDDTIEHRGSASAFDDSIVGGPDYKQKARDLCRQIKSANLGEPANFGCIENQEEVSSAYSWKGNVEMVCNRLGDTWGSWYPEMFGCPKYDSTARYNGSQFQA